MHSSQGHTIPERYKSPAPKLWRSGTGFTTQSKWYWAKPPAPPTASHVTADKTARVWRKLSTLVDGKGFAAGDRQGLAECRCLGGTGFSLSTPAATRCRAAGDRSARRTSRP